MTTLSHPLVSDVHDQFGIAHIQAALLESIRVTVCSLFWLAALPLAAILSLAAMLYDKLLFLRSTAFRLSYLRNHFAIQPLMLRRNGYENRVIGTCKRPKLGVD
jgi:hypothetical protein